MLPKIVSISSLVLVCVSAQAGQATALPQVVFMSAEVTAGALIPKGWEVEAKAEGDLNADGRPDIAYVLRKIDRSKINSEKNANPRVLVVAFADDSKRFKLVLEHKSFIPADENPNIDDPFGGLNVKNGALKVTFHYWASAGSWTTSNTVLTFRYQEGCFKLIGADASSMHRATLEESSTSKNYITGKMVTISKNEENSKKRKTIVSYFDKKPLRCISEIANGMDDYE